MNDGHNCTKILVESMNKAEREISERLLMNDCQKRGCRNLETKCLDCGRVVNKATAICGEWISAKDKLPEHEQEVLFIAIEGMTDERIGIALPESNTILLKRTEIPFSTIKYWMQIPKVPNE